ncbi:hypothetical protein ACI2K4_05415 [Micromonospora sp. NPDC050397]|uniref:hypothetical protein n=1 Tax=Micromonospora sp. NPDC050397 TaxID=3364279 RepID=UPI00384F886A
MSRNPRPTGPLERLGEAEYDELRARTRDLVRQITGRLAANPTLGGPDPAAKPGDVDDEREHRSTRLRRVHAGQLTDALLAEVSAECAAQDAADAVWLGASLADLGSSTGNSRQAARKRWPDLGLIYRTRRWLAGHDQDLITVIRQVLEHSPEIGAAPGSADALDRAVPALREALDRVRADLDSGTVVTPETGRPARWPHLADAVDRHLRAVVELGVPATPGAALAFEGARGVLAHYDSVTAEPATSGAAVGD